MDVIKAIRNRYSCRDYQARPIEKKKLGRILEAARLAPSAHNGQERKFVVVRDKRLRSQLAQAAGQQFVGQAPVVIAAVSTNPQEIMSCGVPTYPVDVAIAVDHITLAATELGLATCWIGAFDQNQAKKILDVPAKCQIVALLPLGYPADSPGPKSRKDQSEIISIDQFENEENQKNLFTRFGD